MTAEPLAKYVVATFSLSNVPGIAEWLNTYAAKGYRLRSRAVSDITVLLIMERYD